jgi:heme A synthase
MFITGGEFPFVGSHSFLLAIMMLFWAGECWLQRKDNKQNKIYAILMLVVALFSLAVGIQGVIVHSQLN